MKSLSLGSPQAIAMRDYYMKNVYVLNGPSPDYLEWVLKENRATYSRENWTYVFTRDEDYTWFIMRWS